MPFRYDHTYWRKRAEEARKVANGMKNDTARQAMLQVAEDYEKLADRLQDATKPPKRNGRG